MTGSPPALDVDALLRDEGFLRAIARGLLFDEHRVDDVVQQAWLKALEQPPRDRAAARGWLASVVRNLSHNEVRGAARRRRRESARAQAAELPSTAEVLQREAARTCVLDAVLALAEPYRGTVLARFYDGLTPGQIARRAGVPAATVRTRLKRALEQLRARLDAEHGGDRREWCLALVPFARPARVTTGLVGSMSAVIGVLSMKKVVLLFAALVLLVSGALLVTPNEARSTTLVPAVDAPSPATAPATAAAGGDAPPPRVAATAVAADSRGAYAGALAGFEGRLVDAGGQPLPGRSVHLLAADPTAFVAAENALTPRLDRHQGISRDDGRFAISGVFPRGRYLLRVGADGERAGFRIVEQSPGPGDVVDLGDVSVDEGCVLTGRVLDAGGAPVVGAEVWAADIPAALFAAVPLDRFDARGPLLVRAPSVTRVAGALTVEVSSLHWLLQRGADEPAAAGSVGPRYLVLDTPEWLSTLHRALPLARARTDADGAFRLQGLVAGGNAVIVRADGWRLGGRPRVLARPGKPRDVGVIELERGDTVRGRVVDGDGRPIAAAEVTAASVDGLVQTGVLCSQPLVRTDTGGRFAIPGVAPGRVLLAARGANGAWSTFGPAPTEEPAELVLPAAVDVTLVLRSDRPVRDPRLTLTPGPAAGELFRFALQGAIDLRDRVRIDQDRVRIVGLTPGLYTVQIAAAGHARFTELLELGAGERVVTLRPEARCDVEVVDAAGRPVAGAEVCLVPQPAPAWLTSRLPSGSSVDHWTSLPAFVATSAADGTATISGAMAGDAVVGARHPGFGSIGQRVTLPVAHLRLQFPVAGGIDGQLFDRGEPASAERWRVVARRTTADGELLPEPVRTAVPRQEGRFALSGLTPGEYELKAERSLHDVGSLGAILEHIRKVDYSWSDDGGTAVQVTVHAGQTTPARFDVDGTRAPPGEPGAAITGTVMIDGQPAAGWQLKYGWRDQVAATVDVAGGFEARGLLVSDAAQELQLLDPGTGACYWTQSVELRAGEERRFDVQVSTGVVEGSVVTVAGGAADGCRVGVAGVAGVSVVVEADAAGRFSLRLPAGDYELYANWQQLEQGRSPRVSVQPGTTVDAGTIGLRTLGRFAGRVLFPSGQPSGVGISLTSLAPVGGSWHFARLAADGAFDLRGLARGTYAVRLTGPGFDHDALPATIEIADSPLLQQTVRVGPARRD